MRSCIRSEKLWDGIQLEPINAQTKNQHDSLPRAAKRPQQLMLLLSSWNLLRLAPDVKEIERFFKQTKRVIVPLTVRDILDEQIAHKLA